MCYNYLFYWCTSSWSSDRTSRRRSGRWRSPPFDVIRTLFSVHPVRTRGVTYGHSLRVWLSLLFAEGQVSLFPGPLVNGTEDRVSGFSKNLTGNGSVAILKERKYEFTTYTTITLKLIQCTCTCIISPLSSASLKVSIGLDLKGVVRLETRFPA